MAESFVVQGSCLNQENTLVLLSTKLVFNEDDFVAFISNNSNNCLCLLV
jgi:hypothetical protein